MIKFIASSDYIRREFLRVDFKKEFIDSAVIVSNDQILFGVSDGEIVFLSGVEIYNPVIDTRIDQDHRDWAQLVDILTSIPDQPVVIQITEGNTRLCIDF